MPFAAIPFLSESDQVTFVTNDGGFFLGSEKKSFTQMTVWQFSLNNKFVLNEISSKILYPSGISGTFKESVGDKAISQIESQRFANSDNSKESSRYSKKFLTEKGYKAAFFFETQPVLLRRAQMNQCDVNICETLSYAWSDKIAERGNFKKTLSYLMTCVKSTPQKPSTQRFANLSPSLKSFLKSSFSPTVTKNIANVTGFFSPSNSHSQKETLLRTESKPNQESDKKKILLRTSFKEGDKKQVESPVRACEAEGYWASQGGVSESRVKKRIHSHGHGSLKHQTSSVRSKIFNKQKILININDRVLIDTLPDFIRCLEINQAMTYVTVKSDISKQPETIILKQPLAKREALSPLVKEAGRSVEQELMNKQCLNKTKRFAIQSSELIQPIRTCALLNPVQRKISALLFLINTLRKQARINLKGKEETSQIKDWYGATLVERLSVVPVTSVKPEPVALLSLYQAKDGKGEILHSDGPNSDVSNRDLSKSAVQYNEVVKSGVSSKFIPHPEACYEKNSSQNAFQGTLLLRHCNVTQKIATSLYPLSFASPLPRRGTGYWGQPIKLLRHRDFSNALLFSKQRRDFENPLGAFEAVNTGLLSVAYVKERSVKKVMNAKQCPLEYRENTAAELLLLNRNALLFKEAFNHIALQIPLIVFDHTPIILDELPLDIATQYKERRDLKKVQLSLKKPHAALLRVSVSNFANPRRDCDVKDMEAALTTKFSTSQALYPSASQALTPQLRKPSASQALTPQLRKPLPLSFASPYPLPRRGTGVLGYWGTGVLGYWGTGHAKLLGTGSEQCKENFNTDSTGDTSNRSYGNTESLPYLYPGQLVAYGENIFHNIATTESGQVLYVDSQRATFRKAQNVLIYSQAIIAVLSGEWIRKGTPLMALSYQKLVTGDIVQGLPKIEQFFEAPLLKDGTFWSDSLQAKLNQFFQEHREKLPLAEAVRKGFSDIQRVLVEGVQRVYISQGVLIADKHLEVIVRQMTCKGRILYSGDTGFLRNELVSLDKIESVNQVTYGQKALYHPQVRGITDASLESESFLSAASFQETTRVLSRDAVIGKTDLMRGLKERVIVGELIQAGTGLANNSVYNLLLD